jgi:hypothetical protein
MEIGVKSRLVLICGLVLLLARSTAVAQTIDEDLRKLLTTEQAEGIGLKSMTKTQREALMSALSDVYEAGFSRSCEGKSSQRPSGPAAPSPTVVEAKIDGEFEGWEGETIVKLMNGQIWQQSEYYYHYHYSYAPDVLIYRSGGGYKMKVEGVDRAVGVKRLR